MRAGYRWRQGLSAWLPALGVLLGLALPGAARAAETVRDAASGLAVVLPEGFAATVVEPMSGDAQINISFRGQAACRVVFAARREPRPSREAVQARVDTAAWREELGRRLPQGPAVVQRFAQDDAIGGTAEVAGALPMSLFVLETPAGRTTLFCQGDEQPTPRQRWRSVAAGLRPPQ